MHHRQIHTLITTFRKSRHAPIHSVTFLVIDGEERRRMKQTDEIVRLKEEQMFLSRNSFAVRFILEPKGELMFQRHPIRSASSGIVISWSVTCDVRFPPHPDRWQFCPPNPSRHSQEYSNLYIIQLSAQTFIHNAILSIDTSTMLDTKKNSFSSWDAVFGDNCLYCLSELRVQIFKQHVFAF